MNEVVIYQFTTTWESCDHTTYLAVRGGKCVGTCMVDYCCEGKRDALLWNLQVAAAFRKGGIARMLVQRACTAATARGCKEIALEWGAMDSAGWIFDWYRRIGFKYDYITHNGVRMKKSLTDKKSGNMETKRLIVENFFLLPGGHGWGNGYVAVPPGHPLWGKTYNDDGFPDIDVHGGVTFTEPCVYGARLAASGREVVPLLEGQRCWQVQNGELLDGDIPDNWWLIGFDTCHADDNADAWTKDRVIEETTELRDQIEALTQQKS